MAVLYLKKYGHRVLENGFDVVPITPGTKFPNFNTWRSLPKITHKRIDRWLANGHAKDGIGIRAAKTPLLDLDCPHGGVRRKTIQFALDTIGYAPERVGAAPKTGLMYGTDTPFKKVQSPAFKDPKGRKCQLEFLGDGQQWVALAIHPDTKEPYRWPERGKNPARMSWDELTPVTREQAEAVRDFFTQECESRGWPRWQSKKKNTCTVVVPARGEPDEMLGESDPLGLSIEEVQDWVNRLPNDESVEYEDEYKVKLDVANYRNVIFAIWHETEGSEEGRKIARGWSEQCRKHEQEVGRFFKLWTSADPKDLEYPVTFRYIIKLVLNIEKDAKRDLRENYLVSLQNVDDLDDLKELIAKIQKTQFDDLDLNALATEVRSALKRVARSTVAPAHARKLIKHAPTNDELPAWVRPWVYILHSKRFYNRGTEIEIDREAFDAGYSRFLNGASASFFALNTAQITAYWNTMYKPGDAEEFLFEGNPCINTFSDRLMPPIPDEYTKEDRKAMRMFRKHMKTMFPDERERRIAMSWLAYIVQTNQRPNWALVIQGIEGDGKSFIGELMGAILGGIRNVRKLDPQQLEDRYTGWAIGQLLAVVEELRLHGHSRFDVLNKIKPFITNPYINVHPKNVNPYTALNTTAYLCLTNFKDALPIDDNDRRYCILMSDLNSADKIRVMTESGYFRDLWNALDRAGAFRKFFMEYELHPEFDPKGRAPLTAARQEMIELSKSDNQVAFEDALAEDRYPQIGPELVVSSALVGHLSDTTGEVLTGKAVSSFLSRNGYVKLPFRIRLDKDADNVESIWVKNKLSFLRSISDISSQRKAVWKFLRDREKKLDL